MRIGIMQPYFFPYLGYFQLINYVDKWIVFDTPQYIRKGWVNRNRVLKQNGGVKYVGITVAKASRETPINRILVSDQHWRKQIINDLDYYKIVRAPYYAQVVDFLNGTFRLQDDRLSIFLTRFLADCCAYLGLEFKYEVFSQMELSLSNITDPGDWAYEISKSLKADEYINPPGGKEIFEERKFFEAGIALRFLEPILVPYDQKSTTFEPGLSIIDVMMFNSQEQIRKMLTEYRLT